MFPDVSFSLSLLFDYSRALLILDISQLKKIKYLSSSYFQDKGKTKITTITIMVYHRVGQNSKERKEIEM